MIKVSLVHAVAFVWLGKFMAPSDKWKHVSRQLHEYELFIVDSGVLYMADEEHRYEVKENEYLLMRPCAHQYGYQASCCSFHWLHFIYNEEFNALDGDYIMIPEHGKLTDLEHCVQFVSDIYYAWQKYEDRHYASFLMTTLLIDIADQCEPVDGQEGNPFPAKKRVGQTAFSNSDWRHEEMSIVKRIKAYIRWNCYITTRVSDIAEYLGYSEKYISQIFKTETGRSIRQYLAEILVGQAKQSLLNSEETISSIAYSYGFSDAQNFSRTFKKISGFTPKEFRKKFFVVYEKN